MNKLASSKTESFSSFVMWSTAASVVAIFAWLISDILIHGATQISWDFLSTAPEKAGREGGIFPILVSTALIMGICLAAALPIALGTAILLAEFSPEKSAFARMVRRALDVLAAVPSIIFGLFGNAFFSVQLGLGFSILSGGLTLACMILPLLIRSLEAGLRANPARDRLAAAALGLSRGATLRHILLPGAAPALLAGLLLGGGRAIAETAALVFTSGYVDRMPHSLLDSGRALSVHIFDLSMNVPGGDQNAYASALVLIILLLIVNTATATVVSRWRKTGLAI